MWYYYFSGHGINILTTYTRCVWRTSQVLGCQGVDRWQVGRKCGGVVLPSSLIPAFSFYCQPLLNLPLMGFAEILFNFFYRWNVKLVWLGLRMVRYILVLWPWTNIWSEDSKLNPSIFRKIYDSMTTSSFKNQPNVPWWPIRCKLHNT